ncbi:MAG: hydrogenase formation protein HypD [Propionibacteriaceae bacterium]|jgi:hydrogenase expression/formation protein HypD|nr:hydrogenase formation protein HypD [Propionibacteriaceae bacterium]
MKFVDEFRDPAAAKQLVNAINALSDKLGRTLRFMEVCGGHTHTIYRHGLEQLMPEGVEFIHGPGCPVCVIPMGRVDDAHWLATRPGVIFTTFGDMMRVPGTVGSLLQAKARGADVRFVYSPLDALKIARDNPEREVVFFAVGFETTAPSTAVTIARAKALGVKNFTVFSNHVLINPPLRAILDGGGADRRTRSTASAVAESARPAPTDPNPSTPGIDGFIGPGHVATVVGSKHFGFIPAEYGLPIVVTGFEPLDILQAVDMLLTQYAQGRCEVENQYARVVREDGNPAALALMDEVFELRETFEWRGLGWISRSGYGISSDYQDFDAEAKFQLPAKRVADNPACECGAVLTGQLKPWQCRVFGTGCTPEKPIGTCMVSPEGACAAYYNFGRVKL